MQFVKVTFVARPACSESRISETHLRANPQTSTLLNYFCSSRRARHFETARETWKATVLGYAVPGYFDARVHRLDPRDDVNGNLIIANGCAVQGGLMESHLKAT